MNASLVSCFSVRLNLLIWFVAGVGIGLLTVSDCVAQSRDTLLLPGEKLEVDGKRAFILWPRPDKRKTPQPWVLYAPTLPAYPDRHEEWMHQQFINAGIAVAGIDVGEAYGSPQGQQGMSALYRELTEKRGFAKRPCLLGRSRGGLWVSSWAIRHPEKVAGIAGIYPVFDLTTYPKVARAAPAYGLTTDELQGQLATHNPISSIEVLAKSKIPMFIIHGDQDTVVPLRQNSQAVQAAYQALGMEDLLTLVVVKGQGHNFWEGFFRCQELVEFVVQRAQAEAPSSGSPNQARDNDTTPEDKDTTPEAVESKE